MSRQYFQRQLLSWFDSFGRKHLPWQQNKSPYRVWISEMMLQQTQVATVIPYFQRFTQRFPNLQVLADATEDEVLHFWTGLGYYSRARNIHKAAQYIVRNLNGIFPNSYLGAQKLPGIGPSTAGAIMAIAFGQQETILDGNVKRVLSRFYGITRYIDQKPCIEQLWHLAKQLTPKRQVANYTQAMMDLGAIICKPRNPQCERCPVNKKCIAFQQQLTNIIPKKSPKSALPLKECVFLIFKDQENILLEKRPTPGVWGGLWSFPEMKGTLDLNELDIICTEYYYLSKAKIRPLPSFRHTFTHFHLNISPVVIKLKSQERQKIAAEGKIWYNLNQPKSIGLSKPVLQILRGL